MTLTARCQPHGYRYGWAALTLGAAVFAGFGSRVAWRLRPVSEGLRGSSGDVEVPKAFAHVTRRGLAEY